MKNIAIIPVRGGSKRLVKKNRLLLNDIPLFLHSVFYAQKNKNIIDKLVISTDCKEIKKIALEHEINVIDRPEFLSGDYASTVSALKHTLETIEEKFDNVILLQATNPLRPKNLINEAYKVFHDGNYDSLMTVTRNNDKLGKIVENKFIPINYKVGQRSQDLEPLYKENGLLYISKTSLILENKILGKKNYSFIVDHPFSKVDIDTLDDFKFANYIIKNYIYE